MEKIIYVELLTRHGRVYDRVRLDSFPATLGRGYHNDVILDDCYVAACETRLELNEDGELMLVSIDSVNGIVKWGCEQRVNRTVITSGDQVRLGHSDMRFMFSDHPMPAPVAIRAGLFDVVRLGNTPLFLWSLFMMSLMVLSLSGYLAQTDNDSLNMLMMGAVSLVLGSLMVAGVWAAGTRLVSHEFRFLQHLAVLSVILVFVEAIEAMVAYVGYIYSPDTLLHYIEMGLYAAMAIVWLFVHLCVVSRSAMVKKLIASFVLTGTIVGMMQFQSFYSEKGEIGELAFSVQLRTHGEDLIPFVSLDELFSEAQGLKAQLDADVKRRSD